MFFKTLFANVIRSPILKATALCVWLPVSALAQADTPPTQPTQPGSSQPGNSQPGDTQPVRSVCETMPGFNDFDFWVGTWKVYSNDEARTFQGDNIISKQHKNCLIMESWTSAQGGDGSSMNYFDPVEKQWRQLWVAGGYSIDYTGGLDDEGSMVLKGKINYYRPDKSHAFRGRWTPSQDGSVRQLFEQYDEEQKTWSVWFDGLYIKQ